jgi:hypothetical protein
MVSGDADYLDVSFWATREVFRRARLHLAVLQTVEFGPIDPMTCACSRRTSATATGAHRQHEGYPF